MPSPVDPQALIDVSAVLDGLRDTLAGTEDDLLACLVVMGEPDPQRTLDGWVDQLVDTLRAVDEVTAQHLATLDRVRVRVGASPTPPEGAGAPPRLPDRDHSELA